MIDRVSERVSEVWFGPRTVPVMSLTPRLSVFSPAKECSVVPPMEMAAMPVEAVTKVLPAGARRMMARSRWDLPLPALPL